MPKCASLPLGNAPFPFQFRVQRVLPFLKGSEGQFEKTPRANLRNSGRRHISSLSHLGGAGDGQKAGNGNPLASMVFQTETEHPDQQGGYKSQQNLSHAEGKQSKNRSTDKLIKGLQCYKRKGSHQQHEENYIGKVKGTENRPQPSRSGKTVAKKSCPEDSHVHTEEWSENQAN